MVDQKAVSMDALMVTKKVTWLVEVWAAGKGQWSVGNLVEKKVSPMVG